MSRENVELVLGFQPDPDMDLVERFSDDGAWAAFSAALSPAFAPDFESANALLGIDKKYTEMDGFRACGSTGSPRGLPNGLRSKKASISVIECSSSLRSLQPFRGARKGSKASRWSAATSWSRSALTRSSVSTAMGTRAARGLARSTTRVSPRRPRPRERRRTACRSIEAGGGRRARRKCRSP
jgi:hypothetical protein